MSTTVAYIITAVIAFGITAGLGFVIIPWLRKLKFGQTILDIGPSWHKSKQGTPNMGGLMFIIGIITAWICLPATVLGALCHDIIKACAKIERREASLRSAEASLAQAKAQAALQGNQSAYTTLRAEVPCFIFSKPSLIFSSGMRSAMIVSRSSRPRI